MRVRKRKEWTQRVFKYVAEPDSIPDELWAIVRRQYTLWNDLCCLSALAAGEAHNADKPTKRMVWKTWDQNAGELIRRSGLNWECGPDVLDRFRTAMTGIGRQGKGPPRPRRRIEHIRIPHRYTGGGVPLARLRSTRAARCRIDYTARPGHGHQPFLFAIGTSAVTGHVVWHRTPPPEAIVKQVAFCGRYHRAFRCWDWTLNVTVEEPPAAPAPLDDERPMAGLDMGWRVMGGYLRLGVLVDQAGRELEVRLPFDASTRSTRRRDHGQGQPAAWTDLARFQQAMDLGLEQCKGSVAAIDPSVPTHRLRLMRVGGLVRLMQAGGPAAPTIRAWLTDYDRLRRACEALRGRLLRRRRHQMRELSLWLCQRYQTIAMETDLGLKDLAEQDIPVGTEGREALRAAQQYRTWAALSEWRRYLREAAAKTGTSLVGEAAGTTRRCARCAVSTVVGATRVATCPNHHEWDQDANGARNLLLQIPGVAVPTRAPKRDAEREAMDIPVQLRAVAVPCSLE